jgi:hypothetical protein
LGTSAFSAILSISSFFFMIAPFRGNPRPPGGPAWVVYFLFIREPEPFATPSLPTGLAERMV